MTTNNLNRARVADLHMTMTDPVERGDIPGIVTLIGRGDEIYVDTIGMKNVGGKEPMRRDTNCRVASIPKPITAAATMILVDDDTARAFLDSSPAMHLGPQAILMALTLSFRSELSIPALDDAIREITSTLRSVEKRVAYVCVRPRPCVGALAEAHPPNIRDVAFKS